MEFEQYNKEVLHLVLETILAQYNLMYSCNTYLSHYVQFIGYLDALSAQSGRA